MSIESYRVRGQLRTCAGPEVELLRVVSARRVVPGSARDGVSGTVDVAADEVARIELDNGFVLWARAADLVREHGQVSLGRDGLPVWGFERLGHIGGDRQASAGERGLGALSLRALDFFGVDLAGRSARALAERFEARLLAGREEGLYACRLDAGEAGQEQGPDAGKPKTPTVELAPLPPLQAGDDPLLVFIHGTASNCSGSFGKLWAADNRAGGRLRGRLAERYRGRAFAFEHRSLTESPIANALKLAQTLPEGARLHLVTHSRGGLVGELLCLGQTRGDGETLEDAWLGALFEDDAILAEQLGLTPLDGDAEAARSQARQADRERLLALRRTLLEKRIEVCRFVRVACPARGTTLASGRLDRWLSMLDFVAGKLGGPLSAAAGAATDFLLAVVKTRTDPRTLPGLEAMMPGSALTRLLASPELGTTADLTVIAGDTEGESLWQKLKLLAVDWFFSADHDLVVNTGSMTGGFARPPGGARMGLDRGAEVNHFAYFTNPRSLGWLEVGLLREDGSDGGLRALHEVAAPQPRWREALARSRDARHPRPLAVILPGTMGSGLRQDGSRVWLSYGALLRGRLGRIAIGRDGVEADTLLDSFYAPLIEFVARSHHVELFPYDWRLSVTASAERLAERLEAWLPEAERHNQPVHLIAHSMGGLVVRAMLGDGGRGAALWQRIKRLPNSRLLMLGTPNQGSHEALRWLTGFNPTLVKLALLDLTRGVHGVIDLVRRFPGLLELLPFADPSAPAGRPDFADPGLWSDLRRATRAGWKAADAADLQAARETWKRLQASPVEPQHMVYVAGVQRATVVDYELVEEESPIHFERRRLAFIATREGDGTVSWASGALPGVRTWYVRDTAHDMLCAQASVLPAYLELLDSGSTRLLPDSPPLRARAAGESERFVLPPLPPADAIPDERDLALAGFGGAPPVRVEASLPVPEIVVSLCHGNLAYARFPVLVGHYLGDTIVSAEAALDARLDGALSRRLQLGLYPGEQGSHALFFNPYPRARPSGAVVVGLGQVGGLSPALLQSGVTAAMVDFALQVANWADARFGSSRPRSAALSCLLVGTGAGGTTVRDSVGAIVRAAVEANQRLRKSGLDDQVLVDRLEFIELHEDVAFAAAEALEAVLGDGELAGRARWPEAVVEEGQGGLRRVRFDEAPEWWQRLRIVVEDGGHNLRFSFASDRARVEETLATGQLALVDAFVREASGSSGSDREIAHTLFEMLLPLRLKERAPRQTHLVLLVDECSARYPWELLEDRWSVDGRPPAVARGVIRQLATPEFRARPDHASGPRAFVVGNPDLGGWARYADLPGARAEARAVDAALSAGGHAVTCLTDAGTQAILAGLHAQAYRVLHLAGHGEHGLRLDPAAPTGAMDGGAREPSTGHCACDGAAAGRPLSGMIIGPRALLTPGDVEQMRWVPELVFINCCHLGRVDPLFRSDRGSLAANLATAFIRMGARAVVAAGWAVDDAAAERFAAVFYARLVAGEPFGEAVRAAREVVYWGFPDRNTWGAYQCYGDPDYRLTGEGGARRRAPVSRFHAPVEAVTALENLTRSLRMDGAHQGEEAIRVRTAAEVADVVARMPESLRERWLARADLNAALGLAWGEARQWVPAIEHLRRAMAAATGDCPLRVIEQHANYLVRHAADEWARHVDGAATDADGHEGGQPAADELPAERRAALLADVDTAIGELGSLCERGATRERLSLLGGAYKRRALLASGGRTGGRKARRKALLDMARCYLEAASLPGLTSSERSYPLVNWACARLLATALGEPASEDGRPVIEQVVARLAGLETCILEQAETRPSFWNAVALADYRLALLLAWGAELDAARFSVEADEIAAAYRLAAGRGASPRECSSVREHIAFIAAHASVAGFSPRLRAALARFRALF
ncbi:MAG: CHAT domain-containing protein [Rhodocyclaceae bacterium]